MGALGDDCFNGDTSADNSNHWQPSKPGISASCFSLISPPSQPALAEIFIVRCDFMGVSKKAQPGERCADIKVAEFQ
jgi:hypothetical protein